MIWGEKINKAHLTIVPMHTHDTAVWVHSMLQCAKMDYCTCPCDPFWKHCRFWVTCGKHYNHNDRVWNKVEDREMKWDTKILHNKTMQFETPMHASQAEYFKLINACAHLDFAWNQGYKFSWALLKSDFKISPKFELNCLLCIPIIVQYLHTNYVSVRFWDISLRIFVITLNVFASEGSTLLGLILPQANFHWALWTGIAGPSQRHDTCVLQLKQGAWHPQSGSLNYTTVQEALQPHLSSHFLRLLIPFL